MRRVAASLLVLGSAIGVLAFSAAWWTIVAALAAAAAAWPLVRCQHPGRLGLLPPVMGADGSRVPARWFCDRCGRTWAAGIDRGPQPVQRFSGFDQSKAVRAAQRASELAASQRELAVRRSGASLPVGLKKRAEPFAQRRRPEPVRSELAG